MYVMDMFRACRTISRLALLLLLLASAASLESLASATPRPAAPPCTRVAFSAAFKQDRLAFCADVVFDFNLGRVTDITLFMTSDGGGSWRQRDARGVVVDDQDAMLGQLIVSPLYEEDRSIYLHTSKGLWKSSDDGDSFVLIDGAAPAELYADRLSPYVEPGVAGLLPERAAFGWANRRMSAKIDPPLHVPVVAAPMDARNFLIPPSFPEDAAMLFAYRIVADPPESHLTTTLFSCTAQFACATPLFEFPTDLDYQGAWLAPDYETSKTIYVAFQGWIGNTNERQLWRSSDGGRTFAPLEKANGLLKAVERVDPFSPAIGLGISDADANRLFLRISYKTLPAEDEKHPKNPPYEQVFTSDDRGETWKRIAYARGRDQPGKRGTLPWNTHNWRAAPAAFISIEDDRLFVLAEKLSNSGRYVGLFCSVDEGRTWERLCQDNR